MTNSLPKRFIMLIAAMLALGACQATAFGPADNSRSYGTHSEP